MVVYEIGTIKAVTSKILFLKQYLIIKYSNLQHTMFKVK